MSKPKRNYFSAVGKKTLSAVTGIMLTIFLIGHLAGNLLIMRGKGEAFNLYANALNSLPFLLAVEFLLMLVFGYHAYMGLRVYLENKKASPDDYQYKKWTGSERSRKSWGSTTMHLSGLVVLFFVILHVLHFKFGKFYPLPENAPQKVTLATGAQTDTHVDAGDYKMNAASTYLGGAHARDLTRLEVEEFKKPLIVALYVFCLLLVGLHLNHGISSSLQSVGASRLSKKMLIGGRIFTILLTGGFIASPLWIFFVRQ
jgi:succinate dehydrogenase / fumarate reductase cytochrome b subunit